MPTELQAALSLTPADLARFWAKVQKGAPNECWPWLGSRVRGRYGQFRAGGMRASHRVACELAHGPAPLAKPHALHARHCNNPACCNGVHLRWGDHAEKMMDMVASGRAAKGARNGTHTQPGKVQHGQKNSNAKLTATDVRRIRRLAAKLPYGSHGKLAAQFGVSISHISRIVRGQLWAIT